MRRSLVMAALAIFDNSLAEPILTAGFIGFVVVAFVLAAWIVIELRR